MRMWPVATLLAGLLLASECARADGGEGFTLGGYVRESPFLWEESAVLEPASHAGTNATNVLNARQNLRAYLSSSVTAGFELKTRLFNGDGARELHALSNLYAGNRTYFDWEWRPIDEERTVLAIVPDRAWLSASTGPVQATVGRQRVAWGTALVWNPIDLFNPSSPLDFDNEEMPGADAARVQVYLGPNSKFELAFAPLPHPDDDVAAAQLVVNHAGYDWIVLGGRRGPDALVGGAWAGSVRGGGFRGELVYTIPRDSLLLPGSAAPQKPGWTGTVDGDYTFASSLYLHGAVLFNELGTTGDAGGARLLDAYRRRWLTPARASLYGEAGRDVGALVRISLDGILNPYDHSWYAGPSARWSAASNFDVTANALVFSGDPGTEFGDDGGMATLWMKWSF